MGLLIDKDCCCLVGGGFLKEIQMFRPTVKEQTVTENTVYDFIPSEI